MKISTEQDIEDLVKSDDNMMRILRIAEELNLPDWWIGAGFLRNKVWSTLEDQDGYSTRDVDLVYFNPEDISPETDWAYDEKMKTKYPDVNWEIRNQARMHYVGNFKKPFSSTADGIAHWPETATSVAVKLENGKLKFLFCYGTEDLLNLIARPTPIFQTGSRLQVVHKRINDKKMERKMA